MILIMEGSLTLADCEIRGSILNLSGVVTLLNTGVSPQVNNVDGRMTLVNSTISGVDGLFTLINLGEMDVTNSTVFGGFLTSWGEHEHFPPPSATFANTIIAGECIGYVANHVTSLGHNIESPGDSCAFDQPTDQVDVSADDLKLGPLQSNLGPTETHRLGEGSVAIDQIPVEDCVDTDGQPLTTDQRGVERPQGEKCDVGAYEVVQATSQ